MQYGENNIENEQMNVYTEVVVLTSALNSEQTH